MRNTGGSEINLRALPGRSGFRVEALHGRRLSRPADVDIAHFVRGPARRKQSGFGKSGNVSILGQALIGGMAGAMLAITVIVGAGTMVHLSLAASLLVMVIAGMVCGSATGFVLRALAYRSDDKKLAFKAEMRVAAPDRQATSHSRPRKARSYFEQHGTTSNLG
jgi:hypothetical protein